MQGYSVISDMQNQSLKTSAGNATTNSTSSNGITNAASQALNAIGSIAKLFAS